MSADRPAERSGTRRGLAGRVLGDRYRIVRVTSAGANTLIADAEDLELDRPVTVKLIRPEWAESAPFRKRFAAQMRGMSSLSHPNIAAVHDWGEEQIGKRTTVYAVVEYLPGGSLRDLFDRGRYLDPSQALVIGLEACRGLDFAHRKGLVHTELTPAKMVFGDDRRLRIVDFALARMLGEHDWAEPATVATHVARYSSPEQALAQPIDGKTDVYSLALILVEAVTGSVPFSARSTVATLSARIGRLMPVSADLGPLASVLERAGRPEPADRYDRLRARPGPRPGGREAAPADADPAARRQPLRGRPEPDAPAQRSDRRHRPSADRRAGGRARPGRRAGRRRRDPAVAAGRRGESASRRPTAGAGRRRAATAAEAAAAPRRRRRPTAAPAAPTQPTASDGVDGRRRRAPASTTATSTAPRTSSPRWPGPTPPTDGDVADRPRSPPSRRATAAARPPARRRSRVRRPPATAPPAGWSGPLETMDGGRRRRRWLAVARRPSSWSARSPALGFLAYSLFRTPTHEVPELVGLDEEAARAQTADFDWDLEIEQDRSDEHPEIGEIIRTAPSAGERLGEGEPFLVVVSEGPELRTLPDLDGLTLTEAETDAGPSSSSSPCRRRTSSTRPCRSAP